MVSKMGFLHLILLVLVIHLQLMPLVAHQTFHESGDDDDRITILNPMDETNIDFLPASALIHSSTWVLVDSVFSKIPDAKEGYVDPVSLSLLWQPADLKVPNLQLALGIHIRNGQMRHLFPAIDLSYADGEHRNRGLNTVPRAHTWISVANNKNSGVVDEMSLLSSFHLELSTRNFKMNETQWTVIDTSTQIKEALEKAIHALVGSPPSELGEGSQFVHVLLPRKHIIPCPKVGHEIRATLQGPTKVEHSTAILIVRISAASAGSKSEHLPSLYEALYQNPKYQRSEYVEFQKRQEARSRKEQEDAARRLQERKGEM
jgi:hypothetical protein